MAMRCFQDMRFFVWSISILLFFDVLAGVYYRSAITTIERRFELSSTKVAIVSSAFQIGNIAVVIFVSYFGSKTHRPRFISLGSALVATGYIVASLPQFIGGRYQYVDTMKNENISSSSRKQVELCNVENAMLHNATASCEENEEIESGNNLYIIIVIGFVLSGIGAAPLQPLAMSYIDDFSHPRKSPVYVGIVMTVGLIGPAFGYLLGALILRIWVDFGWVDTSEITIKPNNSNWVGAWWLGMILTGILIGLATIPVCFFPREMKKQAHKKSSMAEYSFSTDKQDTVGYDHGESHAAHKLGFCQATKRLFTNVTFLFIILMWVSAGLHVVGIITFFPKYLEVQFGVSASKANMYYGAVGIPCLALGTMLGSYIMKRHNPDRLGMIKMIAGGKGAALILSISFIFIGCESIDVAGVTVPYAGSVENAPLSYISYCNSECDCTNGTFAPICGSDGVTYLSPCYAGCTGKHISTQGNVQNYTECSCVNPKNSSDISHWSYPGRCESSKCGEYIVLVLVITALGSACGGIAATPSYMFLMRTVGKKDKAFAIGVSFMLTRLLGWVPGPLLYGKLIDSACIYWTTSFCFDRGYCRLYDTNAFRSRFYSVILSAEIFSTSFAVVLYFLTKRNTSKTGRRGDANATGREKEILLGAPSNSFRAAARLASIGHSQESLEINGNEKILFSKKEVADDVIVDSSD